MKKLFVVAISLLVCIGIEAQSKKPMNFQAEIANRSGDYITFANDKKKLIKKIQVNKDGVFKDTINVVTGRYFMSDGNKYTIVYLKNGFDLKLKMDAKTFDESIVYTGKGANENNFLAKNALYEQKSNLRELINSPEDQFIQGIDKKKVDDLKRLSENKLDAEFVALQKKSIDDNYNAVVKYYKKNYEANLAKSKMNNSVSPSFDYENHKGGKTKLEDFKGKYVYIDVWATWCAPCRAEIPSLKKLEEKYHGKNIEFVSISIDVDKDHEKWKTFVNDKQLGGVQLFADKNWNSDFMKSFGVTSIPRFILIDPSGKVVKSDASRPSSPDLETELDSLLK